MIEMPLLSVPGEITYANIQDLVLTNKDKVVFCISMIFGAHAIYTAFTLWNNRPFVLNSRIEELRGYTIDEICLGPLNTKSIETFASMTLIQWQELIDYLIDLHGAEEVKKSLIKQYNLYQFPRFVKIIRVWPEYKSFNTEFVNKIYYEYSLFSKVLDMQGFDSRNNLIDFIKHDLQIID